MSYQNVFRRYELKYLITKQQKAEIIDRMKNYMEEDEFGKTSVRNLYYDTDNFRLIRRSIEKPVYKEKLRIRSYRKAKEDTEVFVEIKKKYDSVVYKRRLAMPRKEAMHWMESGDYEGETSQIAGEIDYFLNYYGKLEPKVFLSYDREAYKLKGEGEFRVTFDENILCRQEELELGKDAWGTPILEEDKVLMELKCGGGIPLWMTDILSSMGIYRTSFSKYGTAYQKIIFPQIIGVKG